MESNQLMEPSTPPKLVETLTAGFNAVANNIYLIAFPLLLDGFLWLGPHIRVKQLVNPTVTFVFNEAKDFPTPELAAMAEWSREIWEVLLTHFNLISLVRSIPIGVPSLMATVSPIETPFGSAAMLEMNSVIGTILVWATLTLFGILIGSVYFNMISSVTGENTEDHSWNNSFFAFTQILIFSVVFFILIIIISVPTILIVSVLTLFSPMLGEIALLFAGIVAIWFLMPMAFSPHGVFTNYESILSSIGTSIRLVRNFLPGTSLFFLTAIFLYQGLNVLWQKAPATSWMALVGIFGHAFISTGLIASSFVYYRKGIIWMKNKQQQMAVTQ
jgi:hypothetical protein